MENILFNYSEFFNNDGGMEQVKKDFNKLGEELIADAKRIGYDNATGEATI